MEFKFFTNYEAGDRGEYPSTPGRRRLKGKAMCASFSEPKVEKKQVQGNFRTSNHMRFEPLVEKIFLKKHKKIFLRF